MAEEARINLNLDTAKAKADLRDLDRSTAQATRSGNLAATSGRPASQRVGRIMGLLGGMSATSRITRTSGSNVSPWGTAITPFTAALQQLVDNTLGYSAKARNRARDETAESHAVSVGEGGSLWHAQQHYETILPFIDAEERGLNILRQDPKFAGPTLVDLLAQAIPGYFKLIGISFDYIMEGLVGD